MTGMTEIAIALFIAWRLVSFESAQPVVIDDETVTDATPA